MMARGTRPGLRPMEDIHNRNEGKGLMGLDPIFLRRENETYCAVEKSNPRILGRKNSRGRWNYPKDKLRSQEKWHAI